MTPITLYTLSGFPGRQSPLTTPEFWDNIKLTNQISDKIDGEIWRYWRSETIMHLIFNRIVAKYITDYNNADSISMMKMKDAKFNA